MILFLEIDLDIYAWRDGYFIAIQNSNFMLWINLDRYGIKYQIQAFPAQLIAAVELINGLILFRPT